MTSMWSSPERRTEHCAGYDAERTFEHQPCPACGGALLVVTATA